MAVLAFLTPKTSSCPERWQSVVPPNVPLERRERSAIAAQALYRSRDRSKRLLDGALS
jgi:hypothetical protein